MPASRNIEVVPVTQKEAKSFVAKHHRHLKPSLGSVFCLAIADKAKRVRGVVMVGRPVARFLDDGWTLEVNRCCTDGVRNGCSALYAAAWRAAKALGWRRLITYTLPSEGGSSLLGAGWKLVGQRGGGEWNRTARPRVDDHPQVQKLMWEAR